MFLFNSWSKAKRQVKSLTSFNHVDFLKTGQESLWIKWWISLDGGLFVLEKVQLYIYIYINLVIETIVKTETSAYKIIQIECSMRRQSGITQDENTSYFIEILITTDLFRMASVQLTTLIRWIRYIYIYITGRRSILTVQLYTAAVYYVTFMEWADDARYHLALVSIV